LQTKPTVSSTSRRHWQAAFLAAIPACALTFGIPLANRVDVQLFGVPFLVDWTIGWVVVTPLFLFAAYKAEGR
jgi:hypothetical protein